jgi:hypothetical protein
MRGFKAYPLLGMSLVLCALLMGCGSSKPTTYQPLVINAAAPPAGTAGQTYGFTFMATGGKVPYTWSVSAGSLPPGLTLNAGTGAVSGTPTSAGTFTFTLQVSDSQTPTAAVATRNTNIRILAPPPPLTITTRNLTAATINAFYSATLAATGGTLPYSWTITTGTLPAGLTLSQAGIISGTPTALGTSTFTVQVKDSETTAMTATATLSLTVNNPAALTVSTTTVPSGTINTAYTTTLMAHGGVPPYSGWTVATGSLPAGLTLDPGTGIISGTPTAVGSSTFTVQVTDSAGTTATSASLTLVINTGVNDGKLNGTYAFSFNGFNAGNPVFMAGSFVADGNGNVTGGRIDLTTTTGSPQSYTAVTGNYTLGTTLLGSMTLTVGTLGTLNWQLAATTTGSVQFIQNSDSNGNGTYGSGIIKKQDTTAFNLNKISGTYAFGMYGVDTAAGRLARAGVFTVGAGTSGGAISAGAADINDAGTATQTTFTGVIAAVDLTTGRATVTITYSLQQPSSYILYVVSSSEMIALEAEPSTSANLQIGSVLKQVSSTTGLGGGNLTGNDILELNGIGSANSQPAPDVLLGIANFDGVSAFRITADENVGGTLTQPTQTGTYAVDTTTGRVTLTNTDTTAYPAVMYLINANQAFVVGTDSTVKSGLLESQAAANLGNVSISGTYYGGSETPVLAGVTNESDSYVADGNGNFNITYDTTGSTGSQQGLTLAATYQTDTTGRTVVTVNGSTADIMYVVSALRVVEFSTDANPKLIVLAH